MKRIIFGIAVLIAGIVIACSIAAKNEMDKDVKIFLDDFQKRLNGPADEMWELFATNQSKEEILKAIAILQNKDTLLIKSRIVLSAAKSSWIDTWLTVEVPVDLINKGQVWHDKNVLYLKILNRGGRYYIGSLDANELYKHYWMMKDAIENADALARRMADIKIYYDKAKELQKDYDSVVWFVHHKNMTYYYVVNGKYNFDSLKTEKPQEFKMGLIDENGKVIVPVEFNLIGNPYMALDAAVEVRKNGKIGYYSLEGKELAPSIYEWLVPYKEFETIALVKRDSAYGWLDKNFTHHDNFPSKKAEQSIKEFSYLTENTFSFGREHQDLINILYPMTEEFRYRGSGMIIAPAYLVKNNIRPIVDEGYLVSSSNNQDNQLYEFGNVYVENSNEKPFSISETITAFISNFKTRYVGGRGEFYTTHKIVLVDKDQNTVSSILGYGGDFKLRKLRDDLFEAKSTPEDEMGLWEEGGFPYYNYYKFDGKQLTPIESNRLFTPTEFVKLDSSYLSGYFTIYRNHERVIINFAGERTLTLIRDGILASYGFIFPDEDHSFFTNQKWYRPETKSYDEVYSKASEIDKFNLDFLNKLIGSTPDGKSI